jgi:hypothetical protein
VEICYTEISPDWKINVEGVKKSNIYASRRKMAFIVPTVMNLGTSDEFSGAFAKLRNRLLASSWLFICPAVRPSTKMEQLGSRWTKFNLIWYLIIFSKICPEISSLIQSWQ